MADCSVFTWPQAFMVFSAMGGFAAIMWAIAWALVKMAEADHG